MTHFTAAAGPWVIAGAIGGLVGAADIIGTFKDEPNEAVASWPGIVFIIVNALLAILALLAVASGQQPTTARAVWAGLGASVILRSKLFTVRVENRDISVGPSFVVERLLDAIIRSVDRSRARARRAFVAAVVGGNGLDFERTRNSVLADVMGAMQSLTPEEQAHITTQAQLLDKHPGSETDKLKIFCYMVYDLCGQDFLDAALKHQRQVTS